MKGNASRKFDALSQSQANTILPPINQSIDDIGVTDKPPDNLAELTPQVTKKDFFSKNGSASVNLK